jgi:hypothetical protein
MTQIYIWATLTCQFGLDALLAPKAILGSHASDQSLKLSPGSRGDHLLLDEKMATSSTPSNPLAASPELFAVSQSATDYANRRTIDLPESKSADRRRSGEAADADAAARLTARADKDFPRLARSAAPLA